MEGIFQKNPAVIHDQNLRVVFCIESSKDCSFFMLFCFTAAEGLIELWTRKCRGQRPPELRLLWEDGLGINFNSFTVHSKWFSSLPGHMERDVTKCNGWIWRDDPTCRPTPQLDRHWQLRANRLLKLQRNQATKHPAFLVIDDQWQIIITIPLIVSWEQLVRWGATSCDSRRMFAATSCTENIGGNHGSTRGSNNHLCYRKFPIKIIPKSEIRKRHVLFTWFCLPFVCK